MIIDCVSDLHGHYPNLEGGDLLIVAGDLTARDTVQGYDKFFDWFSLQDYENKVYIAGNHDGLIFQRKYSTPKHCDSTYLCDSGTEFEGLKIWGSPWTLEFEGMNPHCKAFTCKSEKELADKWDLIPEDVGILVTHSPPHGIMDKVKDYESGKIRSCGSQYLHTILYAEKISPKIHVFGHIHEGYGHISKMLDFPGVQFVNASHVDENYRPVNKPVRIEI